MLLIHPDVVPDDPDTRAFVDEWLEGFVARGHTAVCICEDPSDFLSSHNFPEHVAWVSPDALTTMLPSHIKGFDHLDVGVMHEVYDWLSCNEPVTPVEVA